ncbi:MAG: ATP phosphoribosyltransferase regulatory subunit [Firmicutes bacterium]|nr:ATP phosphoribosyltransferase regulatory subunit [Bacillota bacterium]
MASLNKKIITLPEGMRDVIFDEAETRREIERRLAAAYEDEGYSEIITPAIEHGELFTGAGLPMGLSGMYKLTDAGGDLAVLRADNTMPMARVASTKLRGAPLPLKLYYNQDIYRISGDYSGHQSEIRQSGVELIGAAGRKSDLMMITLAIEALKTIGPEFKLEIGHVGFYNSLISSLTLNPDEQARIRRLVDSKNAVSLGPDFGPGFDRIRKIPLLFGGDEVFSEAEALADGNEGALEALEYLKNLYRLLGEAGMKDNILIDLGIVHSIDYYTGVVFRGYLSGAGEPILAGGRYDQLLDIFGKNLPATGFAVNVGLAADTLLKRGETKKRSIPDVMIHFDGEAYQYALELRNEYREDGRSCVVSTFDDINDTVEYAKARKIPLVVRVSEDGRREIVS